MPLPDIVQRGADAVGGIVKLATLLGINPAAPYQWHRGIPRAHVLKFADVTGIPLHEVAPDMFPAPEKGKRRNGKG